MNEWEFTGDVNSWINQILDHIPIPPFDRSKIEQSGSGSRKRRDLTLLDKSKRALITGEIKLPYQVDGSSPYITKVVQDARKKARRAKAQFFFTWNVNECVLWETEPADASKLGQDYKSWQVTSVHNQRQMEHRATEEEIRDWLVKFLHGVAQILNGTVKIGRKPPDEKFIDALESSLRTPIQFSYDELEILYKKKRVRARIEKWMREDQGWTIYDDPEGIRENLERASRFACYSLANRLVFHETLLKRYGARLRKLRVPNHINTGDDLWQHLEGYFKGAIKITGDYETVFGEAHQSVGNRIPFHSNEAVPHWRTLIEEIHDFDFSKLDYEVIGTMFERLLSPEERHKYGQHYTRVEIVDLINSFCIRTGDEKVMDPACGGGTFLVRAYARMKALRPEQPHGEILKNIFGVDIMNFATHLSTINLAIRDLVDDENYPQIVRSDFFDIEPDKVFATLPRKAKAGGLGKTQQREVKVPSLDAVIGNPPYIRQEEIPKAKKPRYKELVKKSSSVILSGRSDIHCYFWPHATTFLKQDGYLCLLTSSQWLDVEYGFKLQEWILRNFEIHAVFESVNEPWFVGARVATTVTILKKQADEAKRIENTVKFVQLRRSISDIMSNDGSAVGAMQAADEFRDEIMKLTENRVNDRYRARLVSQKELWDTGVSLGIAMGKTDGKYFGGKWGVHLRAPDIWFEMQTDFGCKFATLNSLADIHIGIISGKDEFFYPRDISAQAMESSISMKEFEKEFGVPLKTVKSGKVCLVRCGKNGDTILPIESQFLEPELHSMMEVKGFTIYPSDCSRMVLLCTKKDKRSKNPYLKAYIDWGEKELYHTGRACAGRVGSDRSWFDLTGHKRGLLFWPKSQQYRHIVPLNKNKLTNNCNLYSLFPNTGVHPDLLAGVLNSTITVLSKFQYGRPVGVEGNLKTEIVDVKMMMVPSTHEAKSLSKTRVAEAFRTLAVRKPMQFLSERRLKTMVLTNKGLEDKLKSLSDLSELNMPDRQELDDAVLEMMGVKSKKRRKEILHNLYSYLRDFFEYTRQKEEKAIVNKNLSRRRGRLKHTEVAAQIFDEIQVSEKWLLQQYEYEFFDIDELFDTYDIPEEGVPRQSPDMFTGSGLTFVKGKKQKNGHVKTRHKEQDMLLMLLVEQGFRGFLRVPYDSKECKRVHTEYAKFIERRDKKLRELVADRTSDEDLQEKILIALRDLLSTL